MSFDPYHSSTKKRPKDCLPNNTGLRFRRYDKQNPEINKWRREMQLFRKRKQQVLALLADTGWSDADIAEWMRTSKPGLAFTPLQYFDKPSGMNRLLNYALKYLPKKC